MGGTLKTIKSSLYRVDKRVLVTVSAFLSVVLAIGIVYGILGPKSADLRESIPLDAVAFVRIKDPASVLRLVSNQSSGSDEEKLALFEGADIAFAITGFEASEESLTEQDSVLNVTPKFAAVVETNAWSWRVRGFVEGPLNEFVRNRMGKGVVIEERSGEFGNMKVWTAADGRKTFAVVKGSRVFFGNELAAVESCLSASEGLEPSLLEDPDLLEFDSRNSDPAILGYFPRRAVEAFADVAGVSAAVSGSEEVGMRAFIARLVPQLMRRSLERVYWTSRVENGRFVDTIEVNMREDMTGVFAETMKPESGNIEKLLELLPQNTESVTRYQLRNPRIAYRSLVLFAAGSADPVSAQLISAFSDSILQPYGIADAELFLGAVGPELLTVQVAGNEEDSVAIVMVKDRESVLKSLAGSFREGTSTESRSEWDILYSNDKTSAAALTTGILVIGDRQAVLESISGNRQKTLIAGQPLFNAVLRSKGTAVTIAVDNPSGTEREAATGENKGNAAYFISETSFNEERVTRTYNSRTGLIGELMDLSGN